MLEMEFTDRIELEDFINNPDICRDVWKYLRSCESGVDFYWGYTSWLMDIVEATPNYSHLFACLQSKPFHALPDTKETMMDNNRCVDGLKLRDEFSDEFLPNDIVVLDGFHRMIGDACTCLEMFVALARRMEHHISEKNIPDIFWEMLDNLSIGDFSNDMFNNEEAYRVGRSVRTEYEIDYVLENLIFRKYTKTGKGGMFPVKTRKYDLREMEIWRQANLYCRETEGDFEG